MSTIIYAHRGASKQAPENTMPAFELAYELGADGIETDVQLTKDNIPVLIHDENLRRTTNGAGFVQDHTYEELKMLDAGYWHSDKYRHTVIPALDDLLEWNQDKQLKLNIELKNNLIEYPNLEKIVCEKVKTYNMDSNVVISSFNRKSLKEITKLKYDIPTALLTSKRSNSLIEDGKQLGVDGLHIRYRLLSRKLVEKAAENKLYIAVYTVNQPFSLSRVIKNKCHALFTDVPDTAISVRNRLT
ncbi:glycerophosphoryl diester phosphodiesterase [Gracilibacillus ureilyticus]|uniref:Glycerophosphoryl diester phosphodiesterase n=1 Tax=Gracilibacillus ureilyticus TaxID=531814 RepID=A0A1H9LUS3_9BACI|nr:glycerophosphodiester phosphodiesterase family protein [Gracilibacillus ureilyticus]SER15164.1 glycerophosphoryl diester phosphodiesterase [Gracilibacillus ureilyticus]